MLVSFFTSGATKKVYVGASGQCREDRNLLRRGFARPPCADGLLRGRGDGRQHAPVSVEPVNGIEKQEKSHKNNEKRYGVPWVRLWLSMCLIYGGTPKLTANCRKSL